MIGWLGPALISGIQVGQQLDCTSLLSKSLEIRVLVFYSSNILLLGIQVHTQEIKGLRKRSCAPIHGNTVQNSHDNGRNSSAHRCVNIRCISTVEYYRA